MKTLQSFLVRSLAAVVVGVLLIKFREDTVHWLTIVIGMLFLLSGVLTIVLRRSEDGQPWMGYMAGAGSIVLGVLLLLMPSSFVGGLRYALAAVLIIGVLYQLIHLAMVARHRRVGVLLWLLPLAEVLMTTLVVWQPFGEFSAPLYVLGWIMMIYGVSELITGIVVMRSIPSEPSASAPSQPSPEPEPSSEPSPELPPSPTEPMS